MCRHYFFNNNHLRMTWQHDHPALGEIISQGAPLAIASICLTLLLYSANTIVLSSVGRVGIFALSFIPFCYIYTLMIVYKLYGHHRMALFISFALSLTVIPVMWAVSKWTPDLLWYSYLIAYLIETLLIFAAHRWLRLRFTIS